MLKILLVTGFDASHEALAKVSVPMMREYALRNHCDLQVSNDSISTRHPTWMKIPIIRRAIERDYDFILWLDTDALIVRTDVDIRTAIQPPADLYLSWHGPETTDWRAPPDLPPHLNTGVMLIRCTQWSKDFFAKVWEVGQIEGALWHDQSTIHHLLGYKYSSRFDWSQYDGLSRSRIVRIARAYTFEAFAQLFRGPDHLVPFAGFLERVTKRELGKKLPLQIVAVRTDCLLPCVASSIINIVHKSHLALDTVEFVVWGRHQANEVSVQTAGAET